MSARESFLLSPYRLPTQSSLYLSDEDVAAFLNGWATLWHPAALAGNPGPPRVCSPYDHEQPSSGHLYAVPATPPLVLPEDWPAKVRDAGAAWFQATADRAETLAAMREAILSLPVAEGFHPNLTEISPEAAAPFLGIGLGLALLEALFEAMEHENLINHAGFWDNIREGIIALTGNDPDESRRRVQAAADLLQSAREILSPATLHVLDLWLVDESRLSEPWPIALDRDLPVNVLTSASVLQRLAREQPDRFALLRERVGADLVEVCGGPYLEREDALLPVESQLWNLTHGQDTYQELIGRPLKVHARRRFGAHPHLPGFLQAAGLTRAVLLAFDESSIPSYRTPVISWASPDGKQVETFTRVPLPADSPQTYFHLAYHLQRTMQQDQAPTLPLLHRDGKSAGPWYDDWLELTRFGPVLGKWNTLSSYLGEVYAGDYASNLSGDEFHSDYLQERAAEGGKRCGGRAVSGLARHVRSRRRLDTAWTLTALHHALRAAIDPDTRTRLADLEDRVESRAEVAEDELDHAVQDAATPLAERLVARGAEQEGYLLLNPCSFVRRVALELTDLRGELPLTGAVKAFQNTDGLARVVVEVPALGFAWLPKQGGAGSSVPSARFRLADDRHVRNEFFEAEVDPQTGGLKAIRDVRLRMNRVGQQVVYNPGGVTRNVVVRTTSTGPALGEIVTEGELADDNGQLLATFKQRFRAWIGRPVLELRIELTPARLPEGVPWHEYYGARFAWREERAALLRGVNGQAQVTGATRVETPDFLSLVVGRQNTTIFPGGLPFHQRHGSRMLDVILIPEGETATTFDLGLTLDREYPAQIALGMVTPAPLVPTKKGPPHVGATGWLFHLDAPNLLLTNLRPVPTEEGQSIVARLLEINGSDGGVQLRCPRDPRRAMLLDARNEMQQEVAIQGDMVDLDVSRHDLLHLRVDF